MMKPKFVLSAIRVNGPALLLGLWALLILAMSSSVEAQSLLWAKPASGIHNELGLAIAVDSAGASYVTGYFNGTVTSAPAK